MRLCAKLERQKDMAHNLLGAVRFDTDYNDLFGRLRTCSVIPQFEADFVGGISTSDWTVVTAGSGSVAMAPGGENSVVLKTLAAGDLAQVTGLRCRYHPGRSARVCFTGVLGSPQPGVITRLGYFDDNDGLFFESNGITNDIAVVVRSSATGSPVDQRFSQATDWDVKLDGSQLAANPALDVSKSQLFLIEFQWMGVGAARFGFILNGLTYYCKIVPHANQTGGPYMNTGSLPIRFEVRCAQFLGAGIAKAICAAVTTEDGSGTWKLGQPMPLFATLIAGVDESGNLQPCKLDSLGQLKVAVSGIDGGTF